MLQNIAELGLLGIPPEANILQVVPLDVKRPLVIASVKYFYEQYERAIRPIVTESHMYWWLEIFEQAFQLPLDDPVDFQMSRMALNVYKKFIFHPNKQPLPLKNNFQIFVRHLFSHLSFFFEYSDVQCDEREYIRQCNEILAVFLQVGRKGLSFLAVETSIHVMRTILGIADTICRGNGLTRLSSGVLKVLFEFWMGAMNVDLSLWLELQTISRGWVENIAFIDQWNSLTRAFSLRVANSLYGETEGRESIVIEWKGLNPDDNPNAEVGHHRTCPNFPTHYTYFLWHVLLYCVGNLTDIQHPVNHHRAMKGLLDVVEIFAFVGRDPPFETVMRDKGLRLQYGPDGSTILRFCGDWFFQTLRDKPEEPYRKGRAVAYEGLCKLFSCRIGGNPFSHVELSLFFDFLREGLKTEDLGIKTSILMNIQSLFASEVEGRMMMIFDVLKTCEEVLCGKQAASYPPDLRKACLTIISSLVSVANHFGTKVYKSLKPQIQRNLVKALKAEVDPVNLQQLLWSVGVCVFEEVEKSKKVGSMFIHQMLGILVKNGAAPNVQYSPEVFCAMYDVLSMFTAIWPRLIANDERIVHDIVSGIAKQIEDQVKLLRTGPAQYGQMLCRALMCLGDYAVSAATIVMVDDELLGDLMRAVQAGYSLRPPPEVPSNQVNVHILKVFKASMHLLYILVGVAGNFPGIERYETSSTVLPDQTRVFDQKGLIHSEYVRHYLLNNSHLLTLVEQPMDMGSHGATMVCRNEFGRRMWDLEYLSEDYIPSTVELQPLGHFRGSSSQGLIGFTQEDDCNIQFMGHHVALDFEQDRNDMDKVLRLMDGVQAVENEKRGQILPVLGQTDLCVREVESPDLYKTDQKFQMSRLFLSQLGFFHIGHERFCQLVQSEEFGGFLSELDSAYPRETHSVSILYVKNGQDLPNQFMKNGTMVSPKFSAFVDALSWKIDLTDPRQNRYLSHLAQDGSSGLTAPYHADGSAETVFHVFPSLPEALGRQESLDRNVVNIIWTEHERDFSSNVIPTLENKVNIVIRPLSCGLVKVRVIHQSVQDIPLVGPLQDGMLLSQRILPQLVTQTAINACLILKKLNLGYVTPYRRRLDHIDAITQNVRKGVTYDNLLATIFLVRKTETAPTTTTTTASPASIGASPVIGGAQPIGTTPIGTAPATSPIAEASVVSTETNSPVAEVSETDPTADPTAAPVMTDATTATMTEEEAAAAAAAAAYQAAYAEQYAAMQAASATEDATATATVTQYDYTAQTTATEMDAATAQYYAAYAAAQQQMDPEAQAAWMAQYAASQGETQGEGQ